jgi:hypothetical protein
MEYDTQIISFDILPQYVLQSKFIQQYLREMPNAPAKDEYNQLCMTVPVGFLGIPYIPTTLEAYSMSEFIIAYKFANWLGLDCPIEFILFVDSCFVDSDTLLTNLQDSSIRQVLLTYVKTVKRVELKPKDRTVGFMNDRDMVIIMWINGKKFKASINMQQFPQYGQHKFYAEHVKVNHLSYGTLLNGTMRICHVMIFVDDEFYEHSFIARSVEK